MTTNGMVEDRMPEAEVALRIAFALLSHADRDGRVEVAIDGAQVRLPGREIFPIATFLVTHGWIQISQAGANAWQGEYERGGQRMRVHARSGVGDVVAGVGPLRVLVECKGGPLQRRRGNPEYPILREALGQLMTLEQVNVDNDRLVVAVPDGSGFRRLVETWQDRPLIRQARIQLVLVGQDGVRADPLWLDP